MTDKEQNPSHKFWNKMPVPQQGERSKTDVGPIDATSAVNTISKIPLTLPNPFYWELLDITDPVQLDELFIFLSNNYVVHPKSHYNFAYSKEFLSWCLHPPGWEKEWHICVRISPTKKLVGFICALPFNIKIMDRVI
jgi:glycylpeptide N-tetradecanoyltransferase